MILWITKKYMLLRLKLLNVVLKCKYYAATGYWYRAKPGDDILSAPMSRGDYEKMTALIGKTYQIDLPPTISIDQITLGLPVDKTLILKRNAFLPFGIFGTLVDSFGTTIAVTLEHAYQDENSIPADSSGAAPCYQPKLPTGVYTCRRGQHRLASMTQDFTTYEITGVPGHTNILFHSGNTQNDSHGCCLLGEHVLTKPDDTKWINNSRIVFAEFMNHQDGVDSFKLVVQ